MGDSLSYLDNLLPVAIYTPGWREVLAVREILSQEDFTVTAVPGL